MSVPIKRDASFSARSPVFVVGSGRCGSTLISNMLRLHPDVLSLSEFFTFVTDLGTLIPPAFPEGLVAPNRFWEIIGTAYRKQNLMLRKGVAMKEVLYPCAPTSRFNAQKGVPAILQTTLPHITQDYDRLFDEIRRFVLSRESVHIEEHYSRLFMWLQERFQRRVWVERSGSSIRIVGRLSRLFPEARFVHTFIDPAFSNDDWLEQSRKLIRPARSAWQTLPSQEQELLQAACEPGFRALKQFRWVFSFILTLETNFAKRSCFTPEQPKSSSMPSKWPSRQLFCKLAGGGLARRAFLKHANERDTQLERGEYLGWLHGFPQAVKDLTAFWSSAKIRSKLSRALGEDGLPMGMQIIGRNHADLTVLRLAYSYEQATQWVSKHPPPLLT